MKSFYATYFLQRNGMSDFSKCTIVEKADFVGICKDIPVTHSFMSYLLMRVNVEEA